MKKIIILFLLNIYLSFASNCQNNINDAMIDNSYLLAGFKIRANFFYEMQGTCFFIKKNNLTYLVTASHVVNGCNQGKKDTLNRFKRMGLFNVEDKRKGDDFDAIYVETGVIYDTSICRNLDYSPDVIAIPIGDSMLLNKKINYTSFASYDLPSTSEKITFYGYPSYKNKFGTSTIALRPTLFESNDYLIHEKSILFSNDNSVKLEITLFDKKIDSSMKGFSGSPVFLTNYKTKRKSFCGVISSVDLISNVIYIVKPEYLHRQLK